MWLLSLILAATLHLSQDTAKVGEYVSVSGTNLPVGARYQLEVCGIGGTSNDCAITQAAFVTVGPSGGFTQSLRISEPPTPCPCTVHAAPYAGTAAEPLDIPITIPGLRFMPGAVKPVSGSAKLLDATVSDDSSPLTQIGGQGSANVTVTFANLSAGPAGDPGVALTLSRGGHEIGRYPLRWSGGDLPPGPRRALVYEVPLPGGWFRDYTIGVAVEDGSGRQPTVRTMAASVHPWGELLAPLALMLGVGCLLAGRRRHYDAVAALPVREGARTGRRSGTAAPGPFSRVEAATLGIYVPETAVSGLAGVSGSGIATDEAPETAVSGLAALPGSAIATDEAPETPVIELF